MTAASPAPRPRGRPKKGNGAVPPASTGIGAARAECAKLTMDADVDVKETAKVLDAALGLYSKGIFRNMLEIAFPKWDKDSIEQTHLMACLIGCGKPMKPPVDWKTPETVT